MKFCRKVLCVNTHRLMESDFRFDLVYNFKTAAMTSRADNCWNLECQFAQTGAAAWQMKITYSVCRRPAVPDL